MRNQEDISSNPANRRRGLRTSSKQYEVYLNFLEKCEPLRTNVLDPTMPSTYIKHKWADMATELNMCSIGPILTAAEWQTRFTNWKNSTKKKYRSIMADQVRAGRGPASGKYLSVLERRAMTVWGRIAKPLTSGLPTGGINKPSTSSNVVEDLKQELELEQELKHEQDELDMNEDVEEITPLPSTSKFAKHAHSSTLPMGLRRPAIKLNVGLSLLKKLQKSSESSEKTERDKLRFEIAKFKYLHPDFEFQLSEED